MKHRVSEQLKDYKETTEKLEKSKLILDYQLYSTQTEKTVVLEALAQLGKTYTKMK
jgi:hypothetical protein